MSGFGNFQELGIEASLFDGLRHGASGFHGSRRVFRTDDHQDRQTFQLAPWHTLRLGAEGAQRTSGDPHGILAVDMPSTRSAGGVPEQIYARGVGIEMFHDQL